MSEDINNVVSTVEARLNISWTSKVSSDVIGDEHSFDMVKKFMLTLLSRLTKKEKGLTLQTSHLIYNVGDELFSTLQPLSPQTKTSLAYCYSITISKEKCSYELHTLVLSVQTLHSVEPSSFSLYSVSKKEILLRQLLSKQHYFVEQTPEWRLPWSLQS